MDKEIREKLKKISEIKPVVDNPAGLMQNYMARKPYNVVAEIIRNFSDEHSIIYDPMFGSGTTIIEACKLGRCAIGTDINPIAYKLCEITLKKWDITKVKDIVDNFLKEVEEACQKYYILQVDDEKRVIERFHFNRDGNTLTPISYWYKVDVGGKLSGRKFSEADENLIKYYYRNNKNNIRNIINQPLMLNSRIAVKKETGNTFDYFCSINIKVLDIIINILNNYKSKYGYEVLWLIISSSINLIKLSDKKASSQMPYWLPKKNVTSRNAVFTIKKKANAVIAGLQYICSERKGYLYTDGNIEKSNIYIYNMPAQKTIDILKEETVDLVLTDPPYTDQVPYLEYSQLWNNVLGLNSEVKYDDELVVSDSIQRKKDINDFYKIFSDIIKQCSYVMKENAYYIMFYHSFDLKSWSEILSIMSKNHLMFVAQLPIKSPRKSFKTVMSPKKTLDGNYILIFKKQKKDISFEEISLEDAELRSINVAKAIIKKRGKATLQELYDEGMLEDAIINGYISVLANKYKNFSNLLNNVVECVDGYWRD